jgi:hypothetical protein
MVNLFEKNLRVHNHTRSHYTNRMGLDDSRGDQVEFKELIGNRNGMSGVVPAIKAGDDIRIPGEQVDNPTLALIPPLRSDNDI